MVFDAEVKVVMVPLNITHTNLFTLEDNERLLQAVSSSPFSTGAKTPLRHTLSTLLNFFRETCSSSRSAFRESASLADLPPRSSDLKVFGFEAPPVHDPLCVAYLSHPHLFKGTRFRVDIETIGRYTTGTTSVDLWDYRGPELTAMDDPESRASWGRHGRNVWVAEEVDVPAFWALFQEVRLLACGQVREADFRLPRRSPSCSASTGRTRCRLSTRQDR